MRSNDVKVSPEIFAAHAQFGGDLELMQKAYEWHDLKTKVRELEETLSCVRKNYASGSTSEINARIDNALSKTDARSPDDQFKWTKAGARTGADGGIRFYSERSGNDEGAKCDHPYLHDTVEECAAAGTNCICGKRRP